MRHDRESSLAVLTRFQRGSSFERQVDRFNVIEADNEADSGPMMSSNKFNLMDFHAACTITQ
jgi:hypothetical protein